MMLKKLPLIFSIVTIIFLNISHSNADLKSPNNLILPAEVVKIQLIGLMDNDKDFKDSGIEQTWNFAHPNNKKNTGPLPNFKMMIKGNSYQMLIDHLNHTITAVSYTHLTLPTNREV